MQRFYFAAAPPQTAGELAIDPQQQMLRALVATVEIGKGAALLDDENRLAEAQHLVQQRRRQIAKPVLFHAGCIAGSHARLAIRSIVSAT